MAVSAPPFGNPAWHAAAQERADPPAVLRELGEIAGMRLGLALGVALMRVAEQLQTQGEQAAASLEQAALLDAAQFARSRKRDLADDFRRFFEQRHARACRPKSSLLTGYALDVDVGQLRVVANEQLEEILDTTILLEAIRSRCASALHGLAEPCRALLEDSGLQPADLPMGPKTIAQALADALNLQFSRIETKQRVVRALCRHWPEGIEPIMRDLLAQLAEPEAGVADAEAGASTGTPPAGRASSPRIARPLADEGVALDDARAMAAACDAVARATAGGRLPRVILAFLEGPWQLLLARIHVASGEQGEDWREALQTMRELVWSLSLRTAREERERLVAALPALVRKLENGLERLGTPAEQRAPFFASLAKYHLKLVNLSGIIAGMEATRAADGADDAAPAAPDVAEAGPERLEIGSCIEFTEADGSQVELKLAWVSAGSHLYLLTNPHGQRALSLNVGELSERLRDGTARVLPGARAEDDSRDARIRDKKTA